MTWLRPVLAILACVPAAAAADWPQWLGPERDGGSAETVAPWTEPPKPLWRAKVGAGFSSPVVAGGKVFVHARVADKNREEVVAFDCATGNELWRTGYDRAPYMSILNTGPQATPAVAGNRVFAYGITGVLTCLDADSGKQVWQTDVLKTLKADVPRFGICCSPMVVGNRVLIAAGGKGSAVVAFDAETGEVQWQALDEPAGTSSPVLYAAAGSEGRLPDVVFMTTLRVVGLNPLDGSVSWEFPLPFQPSGTAPTPIVVGDRIVTSTLTNGTTAVPVTGGAKPTAEKAWQAKDVSGYFSTGVAVGSDKLFLVTNVLKPIPRADLSCVDPATGKELWRRPALGYFHFAMLRTGDGNLLQLDDSGTLRLIAGDATKYRELAKAKVCSGTLVAPALADGRLYARDDSELVCLKLSER